MPEVTARQVITTALRLIGVSAAEEPISADMADSALDALNSLLDAWATEKLLTYHRPRVSLPLVPNQATYTWGVPGTLAAPDIPLPPPVRLELCLLTIPDGIEQEWPLVILDQDAYESWILLKALSSSYPECVYLETSQPYAVLHIWPVPQLPYTLQLFPWQAQQPYTHLDHALPWPNGYLVAFQMNLAVDLGPQYGVEASPTVQRRAEESKRALFPINAEVGRLSLFPGRGVGGSGLGYPRGFYTGRARPWTN